MSKGLAPRGTNFVCWWLGHAWIDVRNEAIESGEMCRRCGRLRPGTYTFRFSEKVRP